MTTNANPTSHTPGPWTVEYAISSNGEGRPRITGMHSALTGGALILASLHDPDGRSHANARLIAAAPDMLEALNLAADDLHMTLRRLEVERQERRDAGHHDSIMGAHLDDMWKNLAVIRAAIAKATGKG